MFENIGGKIKKLAGILYWVGFVAYVIIAIIMIVIGGEEYEEGLTAFGIVLLFAGPFISWVGSLFVCGFGELIEDVSNISSYVCCIKNRENKPDNNEQLKILLDGGLITEDE